ncbi:hypothetical protein C1H71_16795 [Iodobacter fluviatilis]|uniref:Excalibur calcium-binding domain-containing protein n=2 Tax=Iodobacter fluviatilis TaxID=537 RepID=A0A7G3GBU2_9NEIS|nr:hypothetical protein C1H71_16795 [Iodobacter fluviatilis]
MIKFLCALLIAFGAWNWYAKHQRQVDEPLALTSNHAEVVPDTVSAMNTPVPVNRYSCDGRTHCSQMSSCEEATFFLNNCPGTKMDGDHDGTPCEEPFCRH